MNRQLVTAFAAGGTLLAFGIAACSVLYTPAKIPFDSTIAVPTERTIGPTQSLQVTLNSTTSAGEPQSQSQASTHAPPGFDIRTWHSADGRYEVEAEFVRRVGNGVELKRTKDGRIVTVSMAKLSQSDWDWLKTVP